MNFTENYCSKHKIILSVRTYHVDKCLEHNEYDKAIATLKESIKTDKEYPYVVERYMFKLKNIYKDPGEKREISRYFVEHCYRKLYRKY